MKKNYSLANLEKYNKLSSGILGSINVEVPEKAFTLCMTQFFLKYLSLDLVKDKIVFDFGTGTGIVSCVARKLGAKKILASDTDKEIIEYARQNFINNGITDNKAELLNVNGFDLPANYKGNIDLILSNPSQIPLPDKSTILGNYNMGIYGRAMIETILENCLSWISSKGVVLLCHSSLSNPQKTIDKMTQKGFSFDIIATSMCEFYEQLYDDILLEHIYKVGNEIMKKNGKYFFKSYFIKFSQIINYSQ